MTNTMQRADLLKEFGRNHPCKFMGGARVTHPKDKRKLIEVRVYELEVADHLFTITEFPKEQALPIPALKAVLGNAVELYLIAAFASGRVQGLLRGEVKKMLEERGEVSYWID